MVFQNLLNSRAKGAKVETLACKFLKTQGLKIIERNFTQKTGEIDIIALEKNMLVFIEVRFRQNQNFGQGYETVDYRKQQKIINTADLYLSRKKQFQNHTCRFDIISASTYNGELQFKWLKQAFDAD